jgi:hypothetical protein
MKACHYLDDLMLQNRGGEGVSMLSYYLVQYLHDKVGRDLVVLYDFLLVFRRI